MTCNCPEDLPCIPEVPDPKTPDVLPSAPVGNVPVCVLSTLGALSLDFELKGFVTVKQA